MRDRIELITQSDSPGMNDKGVRSTIASEETTQSLSTSIHEEGKFRNSPRKTTIRKIGEASFL